MHACTVLLAVLATTQGGMPESPAPDVRENVRKGLKWLASQQRPDGSWVGNNNTYAVHSTAYAGLALLMEGSTLQEGEYSQQLRNAVAWFEKIAQPNGLLVPSSDPGERGRLMQSHGAALLFLASAYDTDDDSDRRKRVARLLDAAVKYAIDGRTQRGAWGVVAARPGGFDDTTSTIFMIQPLLAAKKAGIAVPRAVFEKATEYLAGATNDAGGVISTPQRGIEVASSAGHPFSTTAVAATYLTAERKPPALRQWVVFAQRNIPPLPRAGADVRQAMVNAYTMQQYLALARVAHALGEDGHATLDPKLPAGDRLRWSAYREPLFDFLTSTQEANGGWPDRYVGGVYCTAIALITLQLDNNYLPAFSR